MQPVELIRARAARARPEAEARWNAVFGGRSGGGLADVTRNFVVAGRPTLNFHPDRIDASGRTVAGGLLADGRYRSQWVTGLSNGSRSAIVGGNRQRFECELFGDVYDGVDPTQVEHPVYGAFDLLRDPHGGSPRFGSSFLVLRPHVLERTTMCVGDSHVGPRDVGTVDAPWCLLAGLAEQAMNHALLERPLDTEALLAVLDGRLLAGAPGRCLDGYVEGQVHGGVDLAKDVEAIVADPSYRDTLVGNDLLLAAEQYGIGLSWHGGSELSVDQVPSDFRGPTMRVVARHVARPDGIVDARSIGAAAAQLDLVPPSPTGDPSDSEYQQLKYLWHVLLAFGRDAGTDGAPGR